MDVDANEQLLVSQFNTLLTTDKESLISELQVFLNYKLNQDECKFFLDMSNWNLQAAIGAYYDYLTPTQQTAGPVSTRTRHDSPGSSQPCGGGGYSPDCRPMTPDNDACSADLIQQREEDEEEEDEMRNRRLQNFICDDRESLALFSDLIPPENQVIPTSCINIASENNIVTGNTRFSIEINIKNLSSQPYSPGTFLRVIGGQVQHIYATHLAVETLSSYGETSVFVTGTAPPIKGKYLTIWSLSNSTGAFICENFYMSIEVTDDVNCISSMMDNSHIINDDVMMDD